MGINLTGIKETIGASLTEEVAIADARFSLKQGQKLAVTVVHEGKDTFSVRGTQIFQATVPCDRCLSPVEIEVPVDLAQIEDVQPYLEGDELDAERMICDEILIGWPMKILCSEDCTGISDYCMEAAPDPRMAAIQDIFNKSKEV